MSNNDLDLYYELKKIKTENIGYDNIMMKQIQGIPTKICQKNR